MGLLSPRLRYIYAAFELAYPMVNEIMDNEKKASWPTDMTTLTEVMNIAARRGYLAELKMTDEGLCIVGENRLYGPREVRIDNFYRFEGISNPEDMAILYLIATEEGTKGTLVDAYGTYADSRINEFIKAVQGIQKAGPDTTGG
jgi:hypothetical protein